MVKHWKEFPRCWDTANMSHWRHTKNAVVIFNFVILIIWQSKHHTNSYVHDLTYDRILHCLSVCVCQTEKLTHWKLSIHVCHVLPEETEEEEEQTAVWIVFIPPSVSLKPFNKVIKIIIFNCILLCILLFQLYRSLNCMLCVFLLCVLFCFFALSLWLILAFSLI